MTTITIEQSLLEQALNALLLPCDRWNKQQFLIVKGAIEALKAALAAPASAPAWHDAPTCPGLWMGWHNHVHQIEAGDLRKFSLNSGLRWFGPLPEDKP